MLKARGGGIRGKRKSREEGDILSSPFFLFPLIPSPPPFPTMPNTWSEKQQTREKYNGHAIIYFLPLIASSIAWQSSGEKIDFSQSIAYTGNWNYLPNLAGFPLILFFWFPVTQLQVTQTWNCLSVNPVRLVGPRPVQPVTLNTLVPSNRIVRSTSVWSRMYSTARDYQLSKDHHTQMHRKFSTILCLCFWLTMTLDRSGLNAPTLCRSGFWQLKGN